MIIKNKNTAKRLRYKIVQCDFDHWISQSISLLSWVENAWTRYDICHACVLLPS